MNGIVIFCFHESIVSITFHCYETILKTHLISETFALLTFVLLLNHSVVYKTLLSYIYSIYMVYCIVRLYMVYYIVRLYAL